MGEGGRRTSYRTSLSFSKMESNLFKILHGSKVKSQEGFHMHSGSTIIEQLDHAIKSSLTSKM